MADETALDVNSYRNFLPPGGLTPEVAPAQQEPQPYALSTTPPPDQQQGQQPSLEQTTPDVEGDEDAQYNMAKERERQNYGTLRNHYGNNDPIKPTPHPELENLASAKALLQDIAKTNPAALKQATPIVTRMEARIRKEEAANHAADLAKLKAEAQSTRMRWEGTGARIQAAEAVTGLVDKQIAAVTAMTTEGDDKSRLQADFTMKTSPLTTMRVNNKYDGLRDIVSNLVALNPGLAPDTALRYVLKWGSPVGSEEGKPAVGFNGMKGKGATHFDVIGHEVNDNYLVKDSDGTTLIMDPNSFTKLDKSRVNGYGIAKKWELEQKQLAADKAKDNWFTRNVTRPLTPPKGYFQ